MVYANGKSYSYSQMRAAALGGLIHGITEINWQTEQPKQNEHGMGPEPVARSYGVETTNGTITLSMNAMEKLRTIAPDGKLNRIPAFDLTFSYGNLQGVKTHIIKDMEFTTDGGGGDVGTARLTKQLNFIAGEVVYK